MYQLRTRRSYIFLQVNVVQLVYPPFPLYHWHLIQPLVHTSVTSDVTRRQERLPLIRKKLPIWHRKPSSTASTASMEMLILKEYNPASTFSRLVILTRPGIGFIKMLYSCTTTSGALHQYIVLPV